ncbi:helix-turn-helix domain-containing protein [Pseudacidovorax sp. RU35E]|uniref:helix-turn-helix domain-containing protein n=1 Tax=Pseudacidovorax sp. RU35E TaxID=1907403 RepID=UPI0009709D84
MQSCLRERPAIHRSFACGRTLDQATESNRSTHQSADSNLKCSTCSPLRSEDATCLEEIPPTPARRPCDAGQSRQQGLGVRAIAQGLQGSPSTVSRELQRNADFSGYASTTARSRCQHCRRGGAPPASSIPRASCSVSSVIAWACAGRPSRLP